MSSVGPADSTHEANLNVITVFVTRRQTCLSLFQQQLFFFLVFIIKKDVVAFHKVSPTSLREIWRDYFCSKWQSFFVDFNLGILFLNLENDYFLFSGSWHHVKLSTLDFYKIFMWFIVIILPTSLLYSIKQNHMYNLPIHFTNMYCMFARCQELD